MPILGASASHGMSARLKSVVTGGTLTDDATYYYRTFTGSGTLGVSVSPLIADILVVAGGGGGQRFNNAGGGAGGLLGLTSQSLTVASHDVTVGAGGLGNTGAGAPTNGSNSQFGSLTAAVGGGNGNAASGGSGGGGTGN